MSEPLLLWLALTFSLFNAMLLVWLGLTVLLNAEHRRVGVWLIGLSMLSAAGIFIGHAMLAAHGLPNITPAMLSRWPLSWLAGFAQPGAWYLAMLWHAGFLERPRAFPHFWRHLIFLTVLITTAVLGLLSLVLFPLPLLRPYQLTVLLPGLRVFGVPFFLLFYLALIILCIGMALDALYHPAPSSRPMGDQARTRARPWLAGASAVLLLVSLFVAALFIRNAERLLGLHPIHFLYPVVTNLMPVYVDLTLLALLALAIFCIGQAVVAYEIFTGKALPRRGLHRHWHNLTILAAGFSAVLAAGLALHWPPIVGVLPAVLVVAVYLAVENWRSYRERERFMERLRPFVAGPRVYDELLAAPGEDAATGDAFRALCAGVLDAARGYLVALGPFAGLVEPLAFPAGPTPVLPAALLERCRVPRTLSLPVTEIDGVAWAAPLWSARGLIGVLLLGEKRDGGLYAQEEMEIARASCERLIDTAAGARLAQRLMIVQRARLAESQVADRRLQRAIHDDILPQLHAALLTMSACPAENDEAITQLTAAHRQLSDLLRNLPAAATVSVARRGVIAALRDAVQDEFPRAFDAVTWEIAPEAEAHALQLPATGAEVLFCAAREALRNAARYARDPARPLHLHISVAAEPVLTLTITDDGIGFAAHAPSQGNGQGMLLHSTMMAVIGGTWAAESRPGEGVRVMLTAPVEVTVEASDC